MKEVSNKNTIKQTGKKNKQTKTQIPDRSKNKTKIYLTKYSINFVPYKFKHLTFANKFNLFLFHFNHRYSAIIVIILFVQYTF